MARHAPKIASMAGSSVPSYRRSVRLPIEREAEVGRLLSQCVPHGQICQFLSSKYGVNIAMIQRYINEVYERWAHLPSMDPNGRREQMRQALFDFYQKAMKAGSHGPAVTALDRVCKLDGLYAKATLEAMGEAGVVPGQSVAENDPDKVRTRIRDLYRQQFGDGAGTVASEPVGAGGEGLN